MFLGGEEGAQRYTHRPRAPSLFPVLLPPASGLGSSRLSGSPATDGLTLPAPPSLFFSKAAAEGYRAGPERGAAARSCKYVCLRETHKLRSGENSRDKPGFPAAARPPGGPWAAGSPEATLGQT